MTGDEMRCVSAKAEKLVEPEQIKADIVRRCPIDSTCEEL